MGRRIKILILFFSITLAGFSQGSGNLDSLIKSLSNPMDDIAKVNLLNKIASDIFFIETDSMYSFANKALEIAENIDYKKGIAEAYNNLGIYYRENGLYDEASKYHFRSLEIMESIGDKNGIARCYNLIGIIYYYLSDYDLSLKYYLKALDINIEQNDTKWIGGNSNNIGMIYEMKGDYQKALEYYNKSLEINKQLGNKNWVANNYGNIGSLYQKTGDPKALDYLQKRLELSKQTNNYDAQISAILEIGKYYNSVHRYYDALKYIASDSIRVNDNQSLFLKNKIARQLALAYAGIGRYDSACKYLKLHILFDDSLNIENHLKKITQIKMQYDFSKNQKIEELRNQKRELVFVAISSLLLVILLIAGLLFARQKALADQQKLERKKLKIENKLLIEDLDYKNKELTDNVRYMLEKNDIINMASEKLNQIKPKFKPENREILNDVILELQSGTDDDIWKEFELRFNQVHSNFYKNLRKDFPGLSPSEQKLAAFLRLKMSTKEIATILHQSPKSIETSRNRLRKKLNIVNKEVTLFEFLSKY
jgi:tetratricopeptide (TPR) repeat protein